MVDQQTLMMLAVEMVDVCDLASQSISKIGFPFFLFCLW